MSKTYAQLEKSRSAIAGSLTRVINQLDSDQPITSVVLKVHNKTVQQVKVNYDATERQLMDHLESDPEAIVAAAERFGDAYIKALELLQQKQDHLDKEKDDEKRAKADRLEQEQQDKRDKWEADQKEQARREALAICQDIESSLAAFNVFIEGYNAECYNFIALQKRLDMAQPLLAQYNEASPSAAKSSDERRAFERKFLVVIDFFAREIAALTPETTSKPTDSSPRSHHGTARIKLTPIELPKFDGSPEAWIQFRDKFKAYVHDNKEVPDVAKFTYLQANIVDKYSPIKDYVISEEGYAQAWKEVTEFYNNDRRILDKHFDMLFRLKPMSSESNEELQRLKNESHTHIEAIKKLVGTKDIGDVIFAHLVIHRLEKHTRDLWETEKKDEIPLWPELEEFLRKRQRVLSTLPAAKTIAKTSDLPSAKGNNFANKSPWKKTSAHIAANATDAPFNKCYLCSEPHRLMRCPQFSAMPVAQRVAKVRELKLCTNCFGSHTSACKSKFSCQTCSLKHHTMLHTEDGQSRNTVSTGAVKKATWGQNAASNAYQLSPAAETFAKTTTMCNASEATSSTISLLSTMMVQVQDVYGQWHCIRTLLDSGAESNYITTRAAKALRLPLQRTMIEASGLGQAKTMIRHKTSATISNNDRSASFKPQLLVAEAITELIPSVPVHRYELRLPPVQLADPTFDVPGDIDMLIGNALFWSIIRNNQINLPNGLTLRDTCFGWIVASSFEAETTGMKTICQLSTLHDLQQTMEKFYKLEDYRYKDRFLTDEEEFCEKHFEQTHQSAQQQLSTRSHAISRQRKAITQER